LGEIAQALVAVPLWDMARWNRPGETIISYIYSSSEGSDSQLVEFPFLVQNRIFILFSDAASNTEDIQRLILNECNKCRIGSEDEGAYVVCINWLPCHLPAAVLRLHF